MLRFDAAGDRGHGPQPPAVHHLLQRRAAPRAGGPSHSFAEMEAVQTPSAARFARRLLRGSLALVAWAIDELQLALAMGGAAVSPAAAAAAAAHG